ncbi:MAG TPA: ATP-binding protein [Anaerolineaceae bacterium]|nr:ATP-binding protein [Anaerolineaceae bacterium]HPN50260.1 ATP-binding protein [Anaerolineaceae bacterium]
MSIRLRLTLLYSAILGLMLICFSLILYFSQSESTLNAIQQDLAFISANLVNEAAWVSMTPPEGTSNPNGNPPPPMGNNLGGEPAFKQVQEREIVRILDPQGSLISSPYNTEGAALPLSDTGLATIRSFNPWHEIVEVDGERLFIYNTPVMVQNRLAMIVQIARPLTERDRSMQTLASTLIFGSLLTTLAAFGIGWFLSGVTLQPIHKITRTAQGIENEQDLSRRVTYSGPPDEVGQLASTFNIMLARLQDAYTRVSHSLEMQRQFVADVSHELRTPLTTLRGNLGLLQRQPPIPAEDQKDVINDMVDESDRLIRLVNELLVMARADANRNLEKSPLAIHPLLEETCRQIQRAEPQRQITLEAGPALMILGDRGALKQVILILLDNAVKHAQDPIAVTAQLDGKEIEIKVSDGGPGIPPAQLEHVFDRFYRADDTPGQSGFGLGLPIARSLVEAQGGSIRMESVCGTGSQVRLRFPAFFSEG